MEGLADGAERDGLEARAARHRVIGHRQERHVRPVAAGETEDRRVMTLVLERDEGLDERPVLDLDEDVAPVGPFTGGGQEVRAEVLASEPERGGADGLVGLKVEASAAEDRLYERGSDAALGLVDFHA